MVTMNTKRDFVFVFSDGHIEIIQADGSPSWMLPDKGQSAPSLATMKAIQVTTFPPPHIFELRHWRTDSKRETTCSFYVEPGTSKADEARAYASALELRGDLS
jgi:hypothetical protein